MKRLLSILLICSTLALCGCETVEKIAEVELPPVPTAQAVQQSQPPADETSEKQETKTTETEHQHIIINFERTELQAFDPQQGSELILSFRYVTPYVHIPANPASEARINEFIAMLNESFYTGDDYGLVYKSNCAPGYNNMLTMAEDHYNYIINSAVNFESGAVSLELSNRRDISAQRCDESVISLCSYDFMNMGDGQEDVAYNVYNFDVHSGELLTMDDICHDKQALQAFVTARIQEKEGEELEFDFSDVNWYFEDMGLCIIRYTEATGAPVSEAWWEYYVPYSELTEYLKPEYMPDEISDTASFSVAAVEGMAESGKEIIDMLRLQEDGQTVYFVADGKASDVRISRVDYADGFYETERLWYCSVMENCALQLVAGAPEGMPELKLSYRDAGGEHELYLSQSVEDGSLILVDDSIQAVG